MFSKTWMQISEKRCLQKHQLQTGHCMVAQQILQKTNFLISLMHSRKKIALIQKKLPQIHQRQIVPQKKALMLFRQICSQHIKMTSTGLSTMQQNRHLSTLSRLSQSLILKLILSESKKVRLLQCSRFCRHLA